EKSRPGYLKMGWSTVGRPSLWIAPRNPLAVAQVVATRLRGAQTAGTPDTESLDSPGAEFLSTVEFAHLMQSADAPVRKYGTPRDARYVRWRYLACPGARYSFTVSDEG